MTETPIESSYPLSYMQQGMLFHHLSGRPGVDIEQIVGVVREPLDETAFAWAWRQVAQRHEVLRTVLSWTDLASPVQQVLADVSLGWEFHDCSQDTAGSQAEQFDAFLEADRARGFDFSRPPLFRVALFRFGQSAYRFVWTVSHVLLDGRSFAVVLRNVFAFYEARIAGRTIELASQPRYQDYIDWLYQLDLEPAREFWSRALRDFPAPTPLPVSKSERQGRGEKSLTVSRETTTRLGAVAKEHGFTLNTIVQGVWALLLARYSGEDDVVFGATRACRRSLPFEAANAVGVFINTLPVRVNASANSPAISWLKQLRESQNAVREFEHAPLAKIHEWSQIEPGKSLFESIIVFDHESLNTAMRKNGEKWEGREFELIEQTNFPLTLYAYGEGELLFKLAYDCKLFEDDTIERALDHLATLLGQIAAEPEQTLANLSMLTPAEREQLLVTWNDTATPYDKYLCIHQAFEAQAARTPDDTAVIFRNKSLSYRALNERANRMARRLQAMGVGPDVLVGIHVHRSLEMMIGLLGVLKAGGAYVPIDPDYPKDRIALMVDDSRIRVLLTESALAAGLPDHRAQVLCLDSDWDAGVPAIEGNVESGVQPHHLAYVIYTSGSTGRPKGVMVEHRNVINFFAGMDQCVGTDRGVWLSVTSLSFDISVLELFWTLARGFKVVIYGGEQRSPTRSFAPTKRIDFSLFYFSADETEGAQEKYRLLMEGAKFADNHGFAAVWTPERHFHAFGGLYPNPSVTSAAIAAVTRNVKIRAGSVVLPLHHPVRVAEEWSVVDNLSNGRVGISFASGWQPRDFLLRPENFSDAKAVMLRDLEIVRRLWRGEEVVFSDAQGNDVPVSILPRPVQAELPFWLTAAGNPQTFEAAGRAGGGVLTHLLGQTLESLSDKLEIYRKAWKDAGHAGNGYVTLMLHAFVGTDADAIRDRVRGPMTEYLRTSVSLLKGYASAWPLFNAQRNGHEVDLTALPKEEMDALLDHSFERYYETSGLFGTPESCLAMVEKAKDVGVDEVACLIDFGIESQVVLDSLVHLDALRRLSNAAEVMDADETAGYSIPALVARHGVTHFQCTPSMAVLLTHSEESKTALAGLDRMLVGGEALPVKLAAELQGIVRGKVINMYGPTETTVWSTTHELAKDDGIVPIGRPIANTQVYLLDRNLQPVPVGVQGELFIGGDSVVRGYFGRPELTAERFLANPFVRSRDARIYRTGDVARYRSDGTIEFLGRGDFQVKIRGHRIELGEIEAVLSEISAVERAVVTASPDSAGHQRLVAYIRFKNGRKASLDELREPLEKRLPEYMTPSAFVFVDAFPLTPNGKIDRKRLPHPDADRPQLKQEYAAPRNRIEKALAEIWQEVLNVERAGIHDNFFELGGHSLSTVQITFRIRREFQVDFPLQILLRVPTIAGLAKEIELKTIEQADAEKLEAMFSEIENLSEEEVQSLLQKSASA